MPDAKEISALTTAESTSASDLFETALPNAMTETGYVSRKVTLNTIATFILNTLLFPSLNTTVKNIIGAINELAQGSGQSLDALNDVDIDDQTLTNGQGIVYDATSQKWKNGSVGASPTAVLLWEGDWSTGSLTVNGISNWLLVGFETSDGLSGYISIGTFRRGCGGYGRYQGNDSIMFSHRFAVNGDTLTIDNDNRGMYFDGGTTYGGNASCHIRKIYGFFKAT